MDELHKWRLVIKCSLMNLNSLNIKLINGNDKGLIKIFFNDKKVNINTYKIA